MKGDAAAFAVVGFSQIDEFEIKGEGTGEQDSALDRESMDEVEGGGGLARGFGVEAAGFRVAAVDGALTEGFNLREEFFAGLFAEYVAEEGAERTNVAAEGSFFELTGLGLQFGQTCGPVVGVP